MSRRVQKVPMVVVAAVLVVAGLLVCAVDGPDQPQDVHHCLTCCTSDHTSALPSHAAITLSLRAAPAPAAAYSLGVSQAFLSPQTPPPKFAL